VKAFFILHDLTRRDVTNKVHNNISHLNSNYVIYLKDPVDISPILFGNRLLLATITWATDNRIWCRLFPAISLFVAEVLKSTFAKF
jgi:hypothetical protein